MSEVSPSALGMKKRARRTANPVLVIAQILMAGCATDDGGSIDCSAAAPLSLESVGDDHIWVADHPQSGCPSLSTSFLFRNTGLAAVAIEEVRVDDDRFSAAAELPRMLAPGATLAVELSYAADGGEAETVANLTLAGPNGCFAAEVAGITVEDSLVSMSAAAIDFGEVPAGATRTRELTISWQRLPSIAAPRVLGFSPSPELFTLLSAPPPDFEPAPCDSQTVRIAFTAPGEPGPYEGSLFWEQESQGFFALLAVPLFATATAAVP